MFHLNQNEQTLFEEISDRASIDSSDQNWGSFSRDLNGDRASISHTLWLSSDDGLTQIRGKSNLIYDRPQAHQPVHFGVGRSIAIAKLTEIKILIAGFEHQKGFSISSLGIKEKNDGY